MSFHCAKIAAVLLVIGTAAGCKDELATSATDVNAVENNACVAILGSIRGSPGDLAEIQQIVTNFDQAWTAGDAVAYAAQYAGAEWVGPNGAVLTDPAEITGLYSFIFGVVFPGTTRQSTIRSLTFLSGTIAVVDIDTQVTGYDTPPAGVVEWAPGIVRAREKNVLQKRAGEWSIVKHHQVLVAPGVP